MRQIRTHKPRNIAEIIEILRVHGSFACPTLPYYRYNRTRKACAKLKRLKLVGVSGYIPEAENLAVTPLFDAWKSAFDSGVYNAGAVQWAKEHTS